jgi:hypothetical protein
MAELRESVAGGVGLIFITNDPNAMPRLQPALGTALGGKRKGASYVGMAPRYGGQLVAMSGDTVPLIKTHGEIVGVSSVGDPVAVAASYGAGRALTLAWNTESVAGAGIETLYLAALDDVVADPPVLVPGGTASVAAALAAGVAGDYRVVMTLPAGVELVSSAPEPDVPGEPEWTATLAAGGSLAVDARLRLPDAAGGYVVTVTELYGHGGGFVPIGADTLTMSLDADRDGLAAAAVAALADLVLAGDDHNRRNRAIDDITRARALSLAEANAAIALLVDAGTELAAITGADTAAAHAALGRLVRAWQASWE